ncbi:hypothetical protein D9M71_547580 [compost metagenome]
MSFNEVIRPHMKNSRVNTVRALVWRFWFDWSMVFVGPVRCESLFTICCAST